MFKVSYLPNMLCFLRIFLTPIFLFFVVITLNNRSANLIIPIVIYGIICLTDFLDGKIAHYLKAVSSMGMKLDITADAIFIFSASICLYLYRALPVWVIIMMLFKFFEFIITSKLLTPKDILVFDPVGKISAVLFFIVPIWTLIFRSNSLLMTLFLVLTVSATLISSLFRIFDCCKSFLMVSK